jgi:hypothetical protein
LTIDALPPRKVACLKGMAWLCKKVVACFMAPLLKAKALAGALKADTRVDARANRAAMASIKCKLFPAIFVEKQ